MRRAGLFLLFVPGLLFLAVILFFPLLQLLLLSIDGGSFRPYAEALSDSTYATVIAISFRIAAISAALCLILAYPLAYFLATARALPRALGFAILLLPFWTSLLVRSYAWMVLLGRNGVLNRWLLDAQLIHQPLKLMYNDTGVLVATVHYLLPFMVFPIFAAMRRIDPSLILAAQGLGASHWTVLRELYLPLTLKGVCAGLALVFILALSAFVTPALLGGGRVIMIANLIQMQVSQFLNWRLAGALSALVLIATIVVYSLLGMLSRRKWDQAQ